MTRFDLARLRPALVSQIADLDRATPAPVAIGSDDRDFSVRALGVGPIEVQIDVRIFPASLELPEEPVGSVDPQVIAAVGKFAERPRIFEMFAGGHGIIANRCGGGAADRINGKWGAGCPIAESVLACLEADCE